MAFAPQVYDSTTVFLWIDSSVSKIATDLFPNTAVKRTIHQDSPVLGQTFQQRYRRTAIIEDAAMRFDMTIVIQDHALRQALYHTWVQKMGQQAYFWLPSYSPDFKVTSVAGSPPFSTQINCTYTGDDYAWALDYKKMHIALWADGDLTSYPTFHEVIDFDNTYIEVDGTVAPTTNAVIMRLYYVKFLSDNFKVSITNNNQQQIDFSFIEDYERTP